MKFLEGYQGKFHDNGFGNDFLDISDTKSTCNKSRYRWWNYIKLKKLLFKWHNHWLNGYLENVRKYMQSISAAAAKLLKYIW